MQYLNTLTETVQNAVLMVQLPMSGDYVASTGGGIYWPERDQLFWKLGDLAPGAQGFLSFSVRFAWGLPRNYQDSTITLLTADNYNVGEFDPQPYLDYVPGQVSTVDLLTPTQFNTQLAANPALQSAYDAAITAGFSFHTAANVSRTEGEVILEAVMVNSGLRIARILAMQGGHVLIYTVNAGSATIEDSTGGMRLDLMTGEKSVWGAWEADLAGASVSLPAGEEATTGCTVDTASATAAGASWAGNTSRRRPGASWRGRPWPPSPAAAASPARCGRWAARSKRSMTATWTAGPIPANIAARLARCAGSAAAFWAA